MDRDLSGGRTTTAIQPDRETVERLRSLGYVGSSALLPAGTRGPDPKDHIAQQQVYNKMLSEAVDDLRGGQPAQRSQNSSAWSR